MRQLQRNALIANQTMMIMTSNMILIVTNKFDPHADRVIAELAAIGAQHLRFNTEEFPARVSLAVSFQNDSWHAVLRLPRGELDLSSVRAVWYRKPDPFVIQEAVADEAHRRFAADQCRAAIAGLWQLLEDRYWLSHPHRIATAERKLYQLLTATRLGFEVPATVVTNDITEASNFTVTKLTSGGVAAKVIGFSPDFMPKTKRLTEANLPPLSSVSYAPVVLQEYVPKAIEIRVTVVSGSVFAAEIHSQNSPKTQIDWRNYDLANVPHLPHSLPTHVEAKCIRLVQELGLEFGALDFILTPDGRYVFLEINPNGQWLWIEDLTGLPIAAAIAKALVTHSAS